MSGFKRFVSLLSSSLIALGGVSASRSVDVLKRKDAGKIGVPLPNISKKNDEAGEKEKKNKKIVGNGKKDGVGGAGQKSASVVKNIDEILSKVPDGVAKYGFGGYIAQCKEKSDESLNRWENIWRSTFIAGSYAGDSKQVIRARGAIEAFYDDAEALDLINKFVSDPENFSNKAKIDDLIGKLSARSWFEYVGSWVAAFVLPTIINVLIFGGVDFSSEDVDKFFPWLVVMWLSNIVIHPVSYDSQKVWGKKEAFEKVLQAFKK